MVFASVIIPTFKRVEQTIQTIELLFASHRRGVDFDIEVIVADSTPDDSLEKALAPKFSQTVIYTRPLKMGVAANKNQGAKVAKHPILIFCDSDMEVESETLFMTLSQLYKQTTAAMIGGKVIWKNGPQDGTVDRPRTEDRINKIGETAYIEALYSRFIATYKKVFWEVGGYDDAAFNMRGEGSDLATRYWRAGYPLVYAEDIVVHHVFDAPDSVALRINHPEWGIAKDFLLLAYKYGMLEGEFPNFSKTIAATFGELKEVGYLRILQGIGKDIDLITQAKPTFNEFNKVKPRYDFKFLEIFSQETLFQNCLQAAQTQLAPIRKDLFTSL